MKRLKVRIYSIIRDDDENNFISNLFDGLIIFLIVLNVVMVIADTFNLPDNLRDLFGALEVVSVAVFTVEYLLRVWTSDYIRPEYPPWKARVRYMFSFMALIDLLAILPFYLPFLFPVDLRVLRALRMVRLLRVLKVNRYTKALSTISSVLRSKKYQLLSSVFVVLILMIISSVLMYAVENEAQPEAFGNAFSALWWAVATFTTVGYGDIYPITVLGKILSAVIALLGIGLVAVPTGIISAGFMERIQGAKENIGNADKKDFCPYCGHKLDE